MASPLPVSNPCMLAELDHMFALQATFVTKLVVSLDSAMDDCVKSNRRVSPVRGRIGYPMLKGAVTRGEEIQQNRSTAGTAPTSGQTGEVRKPSWPWRPSGSLRNSAPPPLLSFFLSNHLSTLRRI